MIIDHADRLHEGVTDCRADKGHTVTFQGPTHGLGFFRLRRQLMAPEILVDNRLSSNNGPQKIAE